MIKDRLGSVVGMRLLLSAGLSPAQADLLRAARAASGDYRRCFIWRPPTWRLGLNLSLSQAIFASLQASGTQQDGMLYPVKL